MTEPVMTDTPLSLDWAKAVPACCTTLNAIANSKAMTIKLRTFANLVNIPTPSLLSCIYNCQHESPTVGEFIQQFQRIGNGLKRHSMEHVNGGKPVRDHSYIVSY